MRAGLMPQDDVKRQDISKLPPATTIAWMQRTGYLQKEEGAGFSAALAHVVQAGKQAWV
jgi:hypothetical protein